MKNNERMKADRSEKRGGTIAMSSQVNQSSAGRNSFIMRIYFLSIFVLLCCFMVSSSAHCFPGWFEFFVLFSFVLY